MVLHNIPLYYYCIKKIQIIKNNQYFMFNLVFLYYNLLPKLDKGHNMKIDNGKYKYEKRRKRTFAPIIYMFSEVVLAWIILSAINVSFQVQTWEMWSHIVLLFAFIYSGYKTFVVLDRQKEYEPA